MIFIDTDIFIDLLRNYPQAKKWFERISFQEALFSAISEAELLSGKDCESPEVREKIIHFLSSMTKISIDNIIAQTAGDCRRRYGIALDDAFIAASAFHHGARLTTRNTKDFSKVKEIEVIKPY